MSTLELGKKACRVPMSSSTLEFIILSSSISPAGLEGCFGEPGRPDSGNDSLVVAEAKATGPSQVDRGAMVEAHCGESEAGKKRATVGTLGFRRSSAGAAVAMELW